jgi:hypothetical protein
MCEKMLALNNIATDSIDGMGLHHQVSTFIVNWKREWQPFGSACRTEGAASLAFLGPTIASTQGVWPVNDSHETLGCQFTNAPLGLSFHAQTCSV